MLIQYAQRTESFKGLTNTNDVDNEVVVVIVQAAVQALLLSAADESFVFHEQTCLVLEDNLECRLLVWDSINIAFNSVKYI